MASLLAHRMADEREADIREITSRVQSRLAPEMLRGGRLSFPQEAYVAMGVRAG